jgi:hypothetical protein
MLQTPNLHATVGDKLILKGLALLTLPLCTASAMAQPYAGIPAKFHGRYYASLALCNKAQPDSDMHLLISATNMGFYASKGTVKSVLTNKDGSITVLAAYEGEGESWHDMDRLSLSADGKTLTVTSPAETELEQMDINRVRCPEKVKKK